MHTYYGTGHIRHREGHCYRLARMALLSGECPPGTLYVEGMVTWERHGWIHHGWLLLPDGQIWDPLLCVIRPAQPKAMTTTRTYTLAQVAAAGCNPDTDGLLSNARG